VIDTAHNDASIEALLKVIRSSFPQQPRRLVFATTRGKDVTGMLRRLIGHFDQILCTQYLSNPRAVSSVELYRKARRLAAETNRSIELQAYPTPLEAWQAVRRQAGPQDLICLTGSFFIAAELLAIIRAEQRAVPD
jgi:dihydrofolate synthase/folylpolyglutamate synthase